MVAVDKNLTTREIQLKHALEILTEKHGAQSETAAVIRERLEEVQADIVESQVDRSHQQSHTQDIGSMMGAPKVKDAALMYIILGGVVFFAISGMSTMFLVNMALRLGQP